MMEKWELKPLVSVGEIKFGMNRSDVHKLFEEKCTEYKKSKYSKNTTDDYGRFHIFYTTDNKVDAVEFFEGIELVMNGNVIFPVEVSEIDRLLPEIEKEGNSFTHIEKSIGIETDSKKTESILVGSKGYYE